MEAEQPSDQPASRLEDALPRVSSSADLVPPAHAEGGTRSEALLAEASGSPPKAAASASSASSPEDPSDEAGDETAALLPSVKPPPAQRSLLNALPSFALGFGLSSASGSGAPPPPTEELERTDSDNRRLAVRGARGRRGRG